MDINPIISLYIYIYIYEPNINLIFNKMSNSQETPKYESHSKIILYYLYD